MAEDMTLASNNDFKSDIRLLHLMEFFYKKEQFSYFIYTFASKYCNLSASKTIRNRKR